MKLLLIGLVGCAVMLLFAAAPETKSSIVVASYNIRCPGDDSPNDWASRADRVAQVIRDHGFELVGMQEATKGQINDLLARLPGFAMVGVGRDDGKNRGEFNCIFYHADRFELLEGSTFWLSETPELAGSRSWNSACPRICTYGVFRDRKTDAKLLFVNTHLDHRSATARFRGAELIAKRLLSGASGLPVVLTGDFNCTPGSAPLLVMDGRLYNTRAFSRLPHTGPDSTYFNFVVDPARRPTNCEIDHIFVSRGVAVLRHATCDDLVDGECPSDHFPVAAEIALP